MHDSYISDMLSNSSDLSRDDLERLAMANVSPDNYYNLCDSIEATSDDELRHIINCHGDVEWEDKADFSGASSNNAGIEYTDTDR